MNNSSVVFYHLPLQVWQRKDWFGSSLGMLHGHLVVNLKEMILKAKMYCILRSAWVFVLALKPAHILITRMEPVSWRGEELARGMPYQFQRKMLSVEFFRNYLFCENLLSSISSKSASNVQKSSNFKRTLCFIVLCFWL